MSNEPVGRRPRPADLHSTLRIAALAAVALGVVLLAAAAFVLSYEGIHHIALRAGVSPELAKLYPLIFDVMLVVAGASALALRGAGWWPRCYAWGSLLILLAAMAVGNAVYATGATLPAQPTKVAVAIIPWALLLMAFGLLLELLRHFRTARSNASIAAAGGGAPGAAAPGIAVAGSVAGAAVNGGPQTAATQAAVSGGKVRELPRVDLDTLLGPKAGEPPAIAILHGIGPGQNDGHQVDPVSYGEETGYVHPDSYLDEGEYSPHGDTGGPGRPGGLAGDTIRDGTRLASHDNAPAEAPATTAEAPAAAAAHPVTPAAALADPETARTASAEPAATPAAAPATSAEPSATPAGAPATAAEPPAPSAAAPATSTETPAGPTAAPPTAEEPLLTPAAAPATAEEPPATPAEPPTTPMEPPETAAETSAVPVAAPAAGAASGTGNGLAAREGPAGAETPAGQEAVAAASQDGAGVKQEAAGAEGPALERIRSTPARPKE